MPDVDASAARDANVQDLDDAGLTARIVDEGPPRLDASIACPPGQVCAIVGPSGAGKTSLLRAIAGLARPRSGHVRCAGRVWMDESRFEPPHRRAVGMVFQHFALFPHMRAVDNVAAAMRGPERRARASALLARLNLEGLDRRYPHQLSGGQKQRVAMARALARDPSLLLLDEPFSSVDQVTRGRLRRELAQHRSALNMPVLLITHDLEEAAALADRMSLLHKGETVQSGAPIEILNRPSSVLAARLVAMPNLDEAIVREQNAARTLLDWRGATLEAAPQPSWPVGARVAWCAPSSALILHRRDRPSRGERENPINGVIASRTDLGDRSSIEHRPANGGKPLRFELSRHVADRNAIAPGASATLSIVARDLHLLTPES